MISREGWQRKKTDSAPTLSAANLQEGSSFTGGKNSIDLIIVGIGASAGGLDALQKSLPGLPANVGMAFVIVQHLAPKYHSRLPSDAGRTATRNLGSREENGTEFTVIFGRMKL